MNKDSETEKLMKKKTGKQIFEGSVFLSAYLSTHPFVQERYLLVRFVNPEMELEMQQRVKERMAGADSGQEEDENKKDVFWFSESVYTDADLDDLPEFDEDEDDEEE